MKMSAFLSVLLVALTACSVEEPFSPSDAQDGKKVTIRVSLPEDPYTKVDFTADEGKLKLAWNPSDCIRVISGTNSQVFTISNIISDHEAEFVGTAVPGTSFDVLYPGTYTSVEEAEADTSTPVQDGNGSTAHLRYKALLSGVDNYTDFAFNSTWASAHGGSLKQAAAVKIVAQIPAGVSNLKSVGLDIAGKNYNLPLNGVDVSAAGQILTAYMMLGWEDINLSAGSKVPVYVMENTTNEVYSRTLSIVGDKTIMQGKMNSFGGNTPIDGLTAQDFVSGNGTEANPYLIANARQLNNMHSVMVNSSTNYFRLLEDIDASSITNWAPLNIASGFSKAMVFDGDGHKISKLTSSGSNYASFSGVLNGTIRNVTFDQATITHSSKIGVVGGFIGTSGVVGNCNNVHVKNSTVTGSTQWVGGFAGEINTTGTIENCSVENTTATCSSHVGEFAGMVRGQQATIRNCYTKNFTLAHNTTPGNTQGLGGFVGCTTVNPIFENCHVEGPVTLSSNVTPDGTKKIVVGGFIGYITAINPTFNDCYVEGSDIDVSGKAEVGGFVGYCDKTARFNRCSVNDIVVSGPYYLGGFLGYGAVSSGYEVPSIFTDCKVDGVTVTQTLGSASSTIFTGGFAGATGQALSFINCQVKGTTVDATAAAIDNVGGFVGCTTYAGANFQNCSVDNATSVTAKANNVGGFVGWANVPDAYKDCSTAASVTVSGSTQNTGGFVGRAAVASAYTNCEANGNVNSANVYVGGFVGQAENASFSLCHYNNGTVTTTANNKNIQAGGFVGQAHTAVSFNGCYVSGATVTGNKAGRVGGFAGQLGYNSAGGNEISTTDCYVKNTTINGAINTGGFVGVQYDTASKCYVEGGTVTAHNADCGGFTGFVQNGNITNCYSTANVIGGSYTAVGGMIGVAYTSDISYCFTAGDISGSNAGAFVGQCAQQGTSPVASLSSCIGWHASLPFCNSNTAGATFTDCYAGNEGSVSSRASAQGWPSTIWDLSGSMPTLIPGSTRIKAVFVGDSITWQWARANRKDSQSTIIDATHGKLGNTPLPSYMSISGSTITTKFHPGFFSGNGYVDKGISGQQTKHMLERFQKDVIALNPQVFVIMGGTNDIANSVDDDTIFNNIASMAETAKAAGIQVVICSITPNNREYTSVGWKSVHIEALNTRFKNLCDATPGYTYCDYWSALVARSSADAAVDTDIDHGLKDEYKLYDDLHPGPAAYTVMEGIIKPIINGLL